MSDSCDRCDGDAEHKVAIAANYEGSHENWRPLCDDCLRKLGEWWRGELHDEQRELVKEWREFAEPEGWDDYTQGVREATESCADGLEDVIVDG